MDTLNNKELELQSEEKYDYIEKIIIESMEIAMGRRRRKKMIISIKIKFFKKRRSNPVSWDNECQKVIDDRKKKLQDFKRSKKMEDFIEYKRMRALARKTINRKNREDLQDLQQVLIKT